MEMDLDCPTRESHDLNYDPSSTDIPILLNSAVRWVTGLTKRTTCDDVIYALLYQDGRHEGETTDNYAIFERWRDVEKPLQARTKILKIWRAWGNEQCNVELSVRRIQEHNYMSGESYHTKRRHRRTRHHRRPSNDCGCRPGTHKNCFSVGKLRSLESMVKLVIAQERKLNEVNERITRTDVKIDNLETRRHFSRMQDNGDNYVQSAYLDSLSEDSMDELFGNVRIEHIDEYLQICDKIFQVEDLLEEQHGKVKEISRHIQNSLARVNPGRDLDLNSVNQQLEQVQVERNRLVSAGMMQRYQEDSVRKELQQCDKQLEIKRQLIRSLKRDFDSLDGKSRDPGNSHSQELRQDMSLDDDDEDNVSVIQIYDSPPKTRNKSVTFDDRLNHLHVIGTSCENLTSASRLNQSITVNSLFGVELVESNTAPKVTSILKNKEHYSFDPKPQYPVNSRVDYTKPPPPYVPKINPKPTLDFLTNSHESGRYHLPSGMYTFAKDGHFSLLDSSTKEYKDEDSNSDTGLSSMHSDESPGLETLV